DGAASLAAARTASSHDIGRIALATTAALIVVIVVPRLRTPTPFIADPALVAAGAFFAYLVAGGYLMAWYPAWALPLLALAWRSRLALAAAVSSALLLLSYVEL